MKSSRPAALNKLRPTGRLPAAQRLDLIIGLPLRDLKGLTNLLAEIYDPASTNFHQYLTPARFNQRFSPSAADYETLREFMSSNHFLITGTDPGRSLLNVNGSVSDIERVFGVRMLLYEHPIEPRSFYAPDTEPTIELAVPLLDVIGLDNSQLPRPNSHQETRGNNPKPLVGSGPGSTYIGKDFPNAYAPGSTLTGKGQTVGLLQLDGYYPADIAAYEGLAGITNVPITNVLLDGATGSPSTNANAVSEVSLDIEMVISMAPGISNLLVYEAPGSSTGPLDILKRMASDNLARQLSSSWAIGDSASADQVYQQFAAQGQSFFQSSGDRGAYYAGLTDREDSSFKTIVGGTILTTGAGAVWKSETAWNDADGTNATGGGISGTYPIPDYQQPVNMSANQGSPTQRNSPDVAMVAQGVWVIYNNGSSGSFEGTSVATPLWAGYTALINEQAAKNQHPAVGFLNPIVYSLGRGLGYSSYFHDILSGNNTNSVVTNNFAAVAGYDLCTGWGTPAGTNFINAVEGLAGAVWVAFGNPDPGDGSYSRPFNTLVRGRDAVAPGGTVAIKGPGSTAETATITKALTLRGAGGMVTIGQ
ncbi:MAG TPA: S53 family peptidase [Verrucomicrobiae bacterium]|nr:S53 family peptidase [Verrucomicrobiae bacterium]